VGFSEMEENNGWGNLKKGGIMKFGLKIVVLVIYVGLCVVLLL